MTVYDNTLAHLIQMAGATGTKEYAWHRALELDRCETGMWSGIAQELVKRMKAQQPASSPAPRKRGR